MSQTTCIPVSSRFWVATPHLVFTLRLARNYTWLKRKAFPVCPWNAYDHNLMFTLEMSSLRAVRCVLQYLQVYILLPSKYSTNTLVMRIIILANIQRIGGNKGALISFNYLLSLILKITSSLLYYKKADILFKIVLSNINFHTKFRMGNISSGCLQQKPKQRPIKPGIRPQPSVSPIESVQIQKKPSIINPKFSPISKFPEIQEFERNFIKISFTDKDNPAGHGTGFIISQTGNECLALTCLHNYRKKGPADRFIISNNQMYQNWQIKLQGEYRLLKKLDWQPHKDNKDIALIRFDWPDQANFKEIALKPPRKQRIKKVYVMGYGESDQLMGSQPSEAELYSEQNNISCLKYKCHTTDGFSGSLILSIEDKEIFGLGVHTMSEPGCQKGVALTQQDLDKWIYKKKIEQVKVQNMVRVINLEQYPDIPKKFQNVKQKLQIGLKIAHHISARNFGIFNSISQVLRQFKNLNSLYLQQNLINNDGLISLIKQIPKLQILDLSDNKITFQVLQCIPKHEKLHKLVLGNLPPKQKNILKNQGIIVQLLNNMSNLNELIIGYNWKKADTQEAVNSLHTPGCIQAFKQKIKQLEHQFETSKKLQDRREKIDDQMVMYYIVNSQKELKYKQVMLAKIQTQQNKYPSPYVLSLKNEIQFLRKLIIQLQIKRDGKGITIYPCNLALQQGDSCIK